MQQKQAAKHDSIVDKLRHPQLARMVTRRFHKNRPRREAFKANFYDPARKALFGRTSWEWCRVGLIYFVFIATLLTIFFAMKQFALSIVITKNLPFLYGASSLLSSNPGMALIAPKTHKEPSDLSLISYSSKESIQSYLDSIARHLKKYQTVADDRKIFDCSNPIGLSARVSDPDGRSCHFDVTNQDRTSGLGPCACKEKDCTNQDFGYSDREPCIAISISNVVGWRPMIERNIEFECTGGSSLDEEHFISVEIYPTSGIQSYFYPYYNAPGHLQPFSFIKVKGLKDGRYTRIKCYPKNNITLIDAEFALGVVNIDFIIQKP